MALARKITKEKYDALSDEMKKEYVLKGSDYVIDLEGEDDALAGMRGARDHEKTARQEAEAKLRKIEDDARQVADELARKNGDLATIDANWQKKLDDAVAAEKASGDKLRGHLKTSLVDAKVAELATRLSSKGHALLAPHIASRLVADFDGETPATKVLGPDGKPSTMTLEDLYNEFYANPTFAVIIDGSKSSGGAGGGQQGSGGANPAPSGSQSSTTTVDLATLNAIDMVAHLDAKS